MPGVPEAVTLRFYDLFYAFMVLVLIRFALDILGAKLHHMVSALVSEVRDAIKGKVSVGSLNFVGFLVTALFGAIVIVAASGQKIFGIAFADILGPKKAEELASYTNYQTLFLVLAAVVVISLACVVIDNRRDK